MIAVSRRWKRVSNSSRSPPGSPETRRGREHSCLSSCWRHGVGLGFRAAALLCSSPGAGLSWWVRGNSGLQAGAARELSAPAESRGWRLSFGSGPA